MSNPTFGTGPITHKVAAAVEKFRVVKLGATGIAHCGAADLPYGAVSASGRSCRGPRRQRSVARPAEHSRRAHRRRPASHQGIRCRVRHRRARIRGSRRQGLQTGTRSIGIAVKASAAGDATVRTQLAGPFVPAPTAP
ncbi:hypothetical protein GS432_19535 [Rhodococcus hoagii]|nr:hypothetical protein [Prescottella equi]